MGISKACMEQKKYNLNLQIFTSLLLLLHGMHTEPRRWGKNHQNETLITVVFHSRLACDTFFMPPQSGRSHTFFLLSYMNIIGGSENIINDQQLIESARGQRESVWSEEKKCRHDCMQIGWIYSQMQCNFSACRLVEFFILTHAFLSCFSHFAHHTSADRPGWRHSAASATLWWWKICNLQPAKRKGDFSSTFKMKKLPHSLQLAYQHYIYFWWMFNKISLRLQLRPH